MYDAPIEVQGRKPAGICSRSTRRSWWRASRAGSACRTVPRTASPGSRRRRRADGSPPCARSSSTAPRRRRLPAHDGDLRAVPRLRGRVPVGRAVRSPHGGRARVAGTLQDGATRSSASRRRVAGLRRRVAAALVVARAHVADVARAAPAARAETVRPATALVALVARTPQRCRAARRVSLHRVRHGRVAARRPPCRAHGDERGRRASRARRTRRRLLRRAPRARGTRAASASSRPSRHRVDAR